MAAGTLPKPFLVDAHVHLNGPDGAASLVSCGIRAARNAGMTGCIPGEGLRPLSLRECIIFNSGKAIYKTGGYGSRFGSPVATKGDARAAIRNLKEAGADIIKVMASGLVSFKRQGTVTAGGFDREELKVIVEEAAAAGLAVMAHANGESAITAAAEAGVRSIEHGFFMTEKSLEVMAGRGVFWTPTVGAIVRAAEAAGTGAGERSFVARLVDQHLRMLKRAAVLGVPLAVGTDCVLPDPAYRRSYNAELAFFEQAGIGRADVMRIASESGARLLGIWSGRLR